MEQVVILNADISSISSKFYYKGEKMVYELIVKLRDRTQCVRQFQNFTDYNSYHSEFTKLLNTVGIVTGLFMVVK
jgi:hypothetical protein